MIAWMNGRCSIFGGPGDKGMANDTGLALYEPSEADLRPDIFTPAPADNPLVPTWTRLRPDFPYIALRFSHNLGRRINQQTPYRITNPATSQWVIGWLVDWGPGERTGRLIDLSPCIAARLRVETDDVVEVEPL